jgi:hypothetical protein
MPGKRFGGPKPDLSNEVTHALVPGGSRALCDGRVHVKGTRRDGYITCCLCLQKRISMLGASFTTRGLERVATSAGAPTVLSLLHRALENAKRLKRWANGKR